MKSRAEKTNQCPNCGQSLNGENFCPSCGQKNDIRRLTFWHFISESLSNFFAVDGRFFHTIRNLFRYPGKVAADYINGKRMQYMHPVRIYFLASLLLLFMLQFAGKDKELVNLEPGVVGNENEQEDTTEKDIKAINQSPELDSLFSKENDGDGSDILNFPFEVQSEEDGGEEGKISKMVGFYREHPEVGVKTALDSLDMKAGLWNKFLYVQSTKISDFDDEEFSKFFSSKLFWVLFLFLPILALVLNLFYLRRKFYYPEHLFFTFYTQSVFFMLISISSLVGYTIGSDRPNIVAAGIFGLYLLIAIKRFYGQPLLKTILKFIFLNIVAVPLFGLFFILATLIAFILF